MRSSPATEVPGINVAALARYLPTSWTTTTRRELAARLLAGGRSNLTCLLSQPGGRGGRRTLGAAPAAARARHAQRT